MEHYSYKQNKKFLENDLAAGKKIVLVLGAGIDVRALSWSNLMNPLFKNALRQICAEKGKTELVNDLFRQFSLGDEDANNLSKCNIVNLFTAPIKSDIIKATLKNLYLYAIQNNMYSKENRNTITTAFNFFRKQKMFNTVNWKNDIYADYYTLYTIARLIILYSNIVGVITYNYNNFLTEAVNYFKRLSEDELAEIFPNTSETPIKERLDRLTLKDIYGNDLKEEWSGQGTIPVYHVHGYIPPQYETENLSGYDIVFSQEEYNNTTWQPYSWENSAQAHLMSQYTCLIMGSSFSDLSAQRMLHYARKNGNRNRIYFFNTLQEEGCEKLLKEIWFDYQNRLGLTTVIGQDFHNLYHDFTNIIYKVTLKNNSNDEEL